MTGPRAALLMLVGLGFGLVLEGLRFGFAGPWRVVITDRDSRGLIAQFLAIGITAAVVFPLLAAFPEELGGAHAPVGIAMIGGAFVFGAMMQLVMGCGSGTLVNAGSGNLIALVALLGFIGGSFLGSLHLNWWTGLGSLPVYTLQGIFGNSAGLWVTLIALAGIGALALSRSAPGKRMPPARLWWAAALIAVLAVLNLVIAGQPWGVVYGLGLWGAKLAQAGGVDVAATAFWSLPSHAERLDQSLLTDVTSLTNIGLIAGAFLVMRWRRVPDAQVVPISGGSWVIVLLAGLVLGYSARIAFGCNVGAFFSGISTGSVHGWVWFFAAFAGSTLGLKLRPALLRPAVASGTVATA
ncbi:MAG: YeeE/YedE family protein [Gammaproteobacteria bacterium]|nr:YeeE/YedE family protein [Gammaproteobacteria bacterium]MDP2140702.1 YeeE/YedE family protein [Gammaproteobacteria bacterium]MDP2346958.1 YeeE/YedE family protein [Gammaproteobacteria bacterium]